MNAPIAEFTDWNGARLGLVAGKDFRKIPIRVLNDLAGTQEGYYEKVLSDRPSKRTSMQSFCWAISALGLKCVIVEDPEIWAKIQQHSRYKARDEPHYRSSMHAAAKHHVVTWRHLKKISCLGGKARALKLTHAKRKKIARMAAKARWRSK